MLLYMRYVGIYVRAVVLICLFSPSSQSVFWDFPIACHGKLTQIVQIDIPHRLMK